MKKLQTMAMQMLKKLQPMQLEVMVLQMIENAMQEKRKLLATLSSVDVTRKRIQDFSGS